MPQNTREAHRVCWNTHEDKKDRCSFDFFGCLWLFAVVGVVSWQSGRIRGWRQVWSSCHRHHHRCRRKICSDGEHRKYLPGRGSVDSWTLKNWRPPLVKIFVFEQLCSPLKLMLVNIILNCSLTTIKQVKRRAPPVNCSHLFLFCGETFSLH